MIMQECPDNIAQLSNLDFCIFYNTAKCQKRDYCLYYQLMQHRARSRELTTTLEEEAQFEARGRKHNWEDLGFK